MEDTFSINSIFFLTFMVDMKNIEGVSSRNTFQTAKSAVNLELFLKYHILRIIFQSTIF